MLKNRSMAMRALCQTLETFSYAMPMVELAHGLTSQQVTSNRSLLHSMRHQEISHNGAPNLNEGEASQYVFMIVPSHR